MSDDAFNQTPLGLYNAWLLWRERQAFAQAKERALREALVTMLFPTPKEGTQHATVPDVVGVKFTLTQAIDRKVDEAALSNVMKMPELAGLNFDRIIRRKPELAVREYKALPEFERRLFDQCLVIKPRTGQLEVTNVPTE